jgi:hypothetical protein
MTVAKLKKNYDISVISLTAIDIGIHIVLMVTSKATGEYDTYSWTLDCYGAEPYLGTFWDDQQSFDMAVMYYIDSIWGKLPFQMATPKELEIYKQLNK